MFGVQKTEPKIRRADENFLFRGRGIIRWRPVLFGTSVAGSTVGILGMGRLGQAVARRLSGWGARLLGHDVSEQRFSYCHDNWIVLKGY